MSTDNSDNEYASIEDELSVDHEQLEAFTADLGRAVGASDDIAEIVAESLTLADLRGHNSHGTRSYPTYASRVDGGGEDVYSLSPDARPEVTVDKKMFAQVDGNDGFGQYIGRYATDLAIEKASEHGVGVVGVRDATHIGRIGEWSEQATAEGFAFSAYVNLQSPGRVTIPGSSARRLSTNPVSFGVPTFDALDFPVVLDMATSQCAGGKISECKDKGIPLPDGWAIGHDGKPYKDPAGVKGDREDAAQLLLGGTVAGHKGFGLSMINELFASIMSGGEIVGQSDYYKGNCGLFVAIDPLMASTQEEIEERVTALAEYIRETESNPNVSMGPAAMGDRALVPGEPEHITEQRRREEGIPMPEKAGQALAELAADLGVEDSVPDAIRNA